MNGADGLRGAIGINCEDHQKSLIELHPLQSIKVKMEKFGVEFDLFLLVLALEQTDHMIALPLF